MSAGASITFDDNAMACGNEFLDCLRCSRDPRLPCNGLFGNPYFHGVLLLIVFEGNTIPEENAATAHSAGRKAPHGWMLSGKRGAARLEIEPERPRALDGLSMRP